MPVNASAPATGRHTLRALCAGRARSRSGWLPILLVLGATSIGVGSLPSIDANAQTPQRIVNVDMRGDLLTATFTDRTDDASLKAAIPDLIAKGVRSIDLRNTPIRDISPLAAMTDLHELNLCGTQVRDFAPLAALTGLRSLNLQFLRIGDVRVLTGLTSLRSLNLGGTEVRELTHIGSLTALRELVLTVTRVKDLTPLAELRQLTSLDLSGSLTSNVRPLAGLTNLRMLSLNGTSVQDLQPLARLENLQKLDLGGTQVSDVRPLGGLRNLRSLDLEGTPVVDIKPLAALINLQTLALGGSQVKDMSPIAALAFARTPAAKPDLAATNPVLFWNDQTLRAIQTTETDPFSASRALAIQSIAVLDTLRSIDKSPSYWVSLNPPPSISVNVAISAAAHTTLVRLFPSRQATLDAALAASLAKDPAGATRDAAVDFGKAVGQAVLAIRDTDGWKAGTPPRPPTGAGKWQPTPPGYLPPLQPHWGTVTPFALVSPGQFRPSPPPSTKSAMFREARTEVERLGGLRSNQRTAEQTETAHYWSDGNGTYTPPGHWNAIAATVMAPRAMGSKAEAEVFAALNIAVADAAIASTDAKYTYWLERPVTVIRYGTDGEPPIPDWAPLLDTPNHPSYISGHSTFSGAAATVLTARLGPQSFSSLSANLPGMARSFTSFRQAAEEAAASRLYGGIHYNFENRIGLAVGQAVGEWTLRMFARATDDRGPFIMVELPNKPAAVGSRSLIGCALDNIAPIVKLRITVDDDGVQELPIDERGYFTLSSKTLPQAGRHSVVLAATSVTGRTSALRLQIDGDIVGTVPIR